MIQTFSSKLLTSMQSNQKRLGKNPYTAHIRLFVVPNFALKTNKKKLKPTWIQPSSPFSMTGTKRYGLNPLWIWRTAYDWHFLINLAQFEKTGQSANYSATKILLNKGKEKNLKRNQTKSRKNQIWPWTNSTFSWKVIITTNTRVFAMFIGSKIKFWF